MSEHLTQVQRDWRMVRAVYEQGLREGLSQGPTHPAIKQSVANMFHGWDGADNALERSVKRFHADHGGDRHEA